MSETCGGCVYDGVPLDGVQIDLDPDGRIQLRGPVVGRGYRLLPGHPAFPGTGTFRTDDLGQVTNGRLQVRGRIDDVLVSGGIKIAPAVLEAAIARVPGVAEVVVVGIPDDEWGQLAVAVVVPQAGGAPRPDPAGLLDRPGGDPAGLRRGGHPARAAPPRGGDPFRNCPCAAPANPTAPRQRGWPKRSFDVPIRRTGRSPVATWRRSPGSPARVCTRGNSNAVALGVPAAHPAGGRRAGADRRRRGNGDRVLLVVEEPAGPGRIAGPAGRRQLRERLLRRHPRDRCATGRSDAVGRFGRRAAPGGEVRCLRLLRGRRGGGSGAGGDDDLVAVAVRRAGRCRRLVLHRRSAPVRVRRLRRAVRLRLLRSAGRARHDLCQQRVAHPVVAGGGDRHRPVGLPRC